MNNNKLSNSNSTPFDPTTKSWCKYISTKTLNCTNCVVGPLSVIQCFCLAFSSLVRFCSFVSSAGANCTCFCFSYFKLQFSQMCPSFPFSHVMLDTKFILSGPTKIKRHVCMCLSRLSIVQEDDFVFKSKCE